VLRVSFLAAAEQGYKRLRPSRWYDAQEEKPKEVRAAVGRGRGSSKLRLLRCQVTVTCFRSFGYDVAIVDRLPIFFVHQLPGFALFPVPAQRTAEPEHVYSVHPETDAPE
jgi:hypothetical protein